MTCKTREALCIGLLGGCLFVVSAGANAAVIISSAATQNMTCGGGVCAPTAAHATLNSTDLENLLSSGNVTVTTTGSGVQANDIQVAAPFEWSSSSGLVLDGHRSVTIDKSVSVSGSGNLSILTNDGGRGGTLYFGTKGNVAFQNLSSKLSVNGTGYTLVNTVQSLASAIASDPGGAFALANNYDASRDGTYSQSPISTTFEGTYEGLGNSIANLQVSAVSQVVGFFSTIDTSGTVRDLRLQNVAISAGQFIPNLIGGLAGENKGTLFDDFVSGAVQGTTKRAEIGGLFGSAGAGATTINCSSTANVTALGTASWAGGLVGSGTGMISNSFAAGAVTVGNGNTRWGVSLAGGLVGYHAGVISGSFATGVVTGGSHSQLGGLVGFAENGVDFAIVNSYAAGAVTGGTAADAGGLVGANAFFQNNGTILDSYSSGQVLAGRSSSVGGLIGYDGTGGGCSCLANAYWDKTTSGIKKSSRGAGSVPNDPGITGLTNKQLRAGLPAGFDSAVWAEKKKVNKGLPYLIANPPPK